MANQRWIADRRLYLTRAGTVVEADDPTRATLLVAAGGSLPYAEALRLGLIAGAAAPPTESAGTKLRKRSIENK